MTRASLAVAVVAFLSLGLKPAAAQYYTQALVRGRFHGRRRRRWECIYRSIQECQPNVLAGNRGFCNPNPYFVPSCRTGRIQATQARA